MNNTQIQYNMTKIKMGYVAPTIDVLELRVENIVCLSYGDSGSAGSDPGINDPGNDYGSF